MTVNGARVLALDADYDESMERAVEAVFKAFPFRWRGKSVLVKPNMLAPHAPEKGVTTHPALVRAVVRRLKKAGAKVMVGDNPGVGGYGISEKTARATGILEAAEGAFVNLAENSVRRPISSKYLDAVTVSGEVFRADVVVNLPKLKTHGLTYLTGAVKNTFGYVVGGDKMRIHSKAVTPRKFAEACLDIYKIRPPELNIMDAVVAMEGNGPSNGSLRRVGRIFASGDAVALDAAMARLVGRGVSEIPFLELAREKGVGETDFSRIRIEGELPRFADYKLPPTFLPGFFGVVINRFMSRWINCAPEVVEKKCVSCGNCVKHCPVEAMTMKKKEPPRVALDKCINCYCCQELCPEDAIRLSGRMIGTIRRRLLGAEGSG